MAITLETKFFNGASWADLSKVVFTSPNMNSPNTAGTRSHIFPGGSIPLGLWYEDAANMYRIEDEQLLTDTQYDNADYVSASGTSIFSGVRCVNFNVTEGEAYNCRLTAWDDVSHSSTNNEILLGDYCRVSAYCFYWEGDTYESPTAITTVSGIVFNQILKGDVFYYGDFDIRYRTGTNLNGDVLVFKPILYDIPSTLSYGTHDFVITFMYSYT